MPKKTKLKKKDIKECLWFWFWKLYIRLRDTNSRWYWNCISSWKKLYWAEWQAWHFVPNWSCQYLTWNEDNVHLQSYSDNVMKHWNLLWYEENLIKKIWKSKVEKLKQDKNKIKQWKEYELKELIIEYKNKVFSIIQTKTKKLQKEVLEYIITKHKNKWEELDWWIDEFKKLLKKL